MMAGMLEVSISYGNEHGDGVRSYLVRTGAGYFDTEIYRSAVSKALDEFASEEPQAIVSRIGIRPVPVKIL